MLMQNRTVKQSAT